jgi:hypothetical protein
LAVGRLSYNEGAGGGRRKRERKERRWGGGEGKDVYVYFQKECVYINKLLV